ERVFQFASNAGARFWYGELRNQNATSKYYLRDITGLEGIPDSFGVVLSYANGDGREARVEFMKGDLTFVVHMGSNGTDYSAQAVHQALLESRRANAPSATHGPAANRTLMVAGGIAIGGVAI